MSKLDIDPGLVAECRAAASQIAGQVSEEIAGKTTVSVERTITRLLGVLLAALAAQYVIDGIKGVLG